MATHKNLTNRRIMHLSLIWCLFFCTVFLVNASSLFAAEKLVVKNALNGKAFTVDPDAGNSYKLDIMGHSGGDSHTQITTGLTNSRMTIMASNATDFAPRIQFVGPEDSLASIRGWAIFDIGSRLHSLPNAVFTLRHAAPGPVTTTMFQVDGTYKVTFPNGNVGIGTSSPQSKLHINGYVQLATTSGIPPEADCLDSTVYGRMKVDPTGSGTLWICTETGWSGK